MKRHRLTEFPVIPSRSKTWSLVIESKSCTNEILDIRLPTTRQYHGFLATLKTKLKEMKKKANQFESPGYDNCKRSLDLGVRNNLEKVILAFIGLLIHGSILTLDHINCTIRYCIRQTDPTQS